MNVLLIASLIIFGQVKEQVSFDTKGSIIELTASDANRLKIFQNVEGFEKATMYKVSPTKYTIEILYRKDSKLYKMDSTITQANFTAFRTNIDKLLLVHPKLDRSGWGLFLLGQLWLAFAEWASCVVSLLPEDTDPKVRAATHLLTGGAGFFVPLYLTFDKSVTLGQARLSFSWARQGYYGGFVLRDLLNWREWGEGYYDKSYQATMLVGGILGTWTGYSFAGTRNLSPGRADLMGLFGYCGAIYGGGTTALLIPWKGSSSESIRWKIKLCELSGLLGMGYGGYLWYTRAPDIYTFGDAIGYRTFTVMSALTSWNLITYFPWERIRNEWEPKAYIAVGMALNGVGMWKGLQLFNRIDLELVDGLALVGGAIAGGLVGGAFAMLTDPDWKVAFSEILACGWGGYFLTYRIISRGRGAVGKSMGFQFYPENLSALWLGKVQNCAVSVPIIISNF